MRELQIGARFVLVGWNRNACPFGAGHLSWQLHRNRNAVGICSSARATSQLPSSEMKIEYSMSLRALRTLSERLPYPTPFAHTRLLIRPIGRNSPSATTIASLA
jgi:hypothetical protein